MTARRTTALSALLVLGACGAQPEAPAPAATELAYVIPASNPITYASDDTARVYIEVGPGQMMEQTMGQSSRVQMTFAPIVGTAGNLQVTARYVDFLAYMESSMMPRQEVGGEALMTGDFVLSLTPDGEVDQTSGPELPEEVQNLTMGANMFSDFFLRLPNTVVQPGASWTDTISVDEEENGTHTNSHTVIVSTFRADTTVAGRTLWIIEARKASNLVVEGDMQGMTMRNELSGTIEETSLWDPVRRLLHSSSSIGTMTGTVSIPSAGMSDIPIDVNNRRHVRLVEGAS